VLHLVLHFAVVGLPSLILRFYLLSSFQLPASSPPRDSLHHSNPVASFLLPQPPPPPSAAAVEAGSTARRGRVPSGRIRRRPSRAVPSGRRSLPRLHPRRGGGLPLSRNSSRPVQPPSPPSHGGCGPLVT
jgi:hypothetical protein